MQDQGNDPGLTAMDYRTAGVDVAAGRAFVDRIRSSVESTRRPEVLAGLGGFAGFTRLPEGLHRPVLVAGSDGVGTKLELAQIHGRHHGVGIDLVAMCANDVITSGAEPLFFLDYIATGSLTPEALAEVVEGIAEGCRTSGCSLLGGETAEMPGFYPQGRYDLAGFCVGVVEEDELIDGQRVQEGDRIVAIGSSGAHSNGFSLIRRILEGTQAPSIEPSSETGPSPAIEDILRPTRLYAPLVKTLRSEGLSPRAMAHITGGGLPENLPRCLPAGLHASIDPRSWERPPLFRWLQKAGGIPETDLWNTFNLGIGFCLVVSPQDLERTLSICRQQSHIAWELGTVRRGPPPEPDRPLTGLPY